MKPIIIALIFIPSFAWALSYFRPPHSDPVFEAIHQGDREAVLKSLKEGYDPNTEGLPGHTAVSYAAKCRRLQILKDLVEYGGSVNLNAVRASRAQCPVDILWGDAGPRPTGNTFAYLFWEKGYFWRFTPIPLFMLAVIIPLIVVIRKKLRKKANRVAGS
jgi:hypothetical protein